MANQSALQVDKIIITRQNPEALEPLPPSELEYGELAVDQAGKLYTADKDNNVVVAGGGEEQEWSEIDNQTAAEPPNPRQADQLEGYDVQAIVEKAVEAATLIDDLTPPEPESIKDADTLNGYTAEEIIENNGISLYTHSKVGTVHNFSGSGINGRAKMTANVETGDSITVNGTPVTAYIGTDEAVASMAGNEWNGKWITFTFEGNTLNFKGGNGLNSEDKSKLIPENIKKGVTFFEGTSKEVVGTFTSDANATAAQILSGYTAYVKGTKVTGSLDPVPHVLGACSHMCYKSNSHNQGCILAISFSDTIAAKSQITYQPENTAISGIFTKSMRIKVRILNGPRGARVTINGTSISDGTIINVTSSSVINFYRSTNEANYGETGSILVFEEVLV